MVWCGHSWSATHLVVVEPKYDSACLWNLVASWSRHRAPEFPRLTAMTSMPVVMGAHRYSHGKCCAVEVEALSRYCVPVVRIIDWVSWRLVDAMSNSPHLQLLARYVESMECSRRFRDVNTVVSPVQFLPQDRITETRRK